MKSARVTKWKSTWMLPTVLAILISVQLISVQLADAEDRATAGREETVGGERLLRAPAAAPSNAVSRKRYPGGADEDDLQVHATLPIPSRTLDGSPVTMASGESAEGQAPPPAND